MSYAGAPVDEEQVEEEPNDDAKSANGVQLGTITGELTGKEQDHFTISTPESSAAGGYFEIRITDIASTELIRVDVYSSFDEGQIYYDGSDSSGQSVLVYFLAAPEQAYRIVVGHWNLGSTAVSSYKLDLRYKRFVDVYEPNNEQDVAADIELDVPVSAFMAAGHRAAAVESAEFSDWYAFQAAAGTLNVLIDQVPKNVELVAQLFNAAGVKVGAAQGGGNQGADVMLSRTLPADGRYFLHVTHEPLAPATHGPLTVDGPPTHVVQPYSLLVSQ